LFVLIYPEISGNANLLNAGNCSPEVTASHPVSLASSDHRAENLTLHIQSFHYCFIISEWLV